LPNLISHESDVEGKPHTVVSGWKVDTQVKHLPDMVRPMAAKGKARLKGLIWVPGIASS